MSAKKLTFILAVLLLTGAIGVGASLSWPGPGQDRHPKNPPLNEAKLQPNEERRAPKPAAEPGPKEKNALVSVPFSGIVKMTSSYKVKGVHKEVSIEIAEWGNLPIKADFFPRIREPALPLDVNLFRIAREAKIGDYATFKVTGGPYTERYKLVVFDKNENRVGVGLGESYIRREWTTDVTKPFDIGTAAHVHGSLYSSYAGFPSGFKKTGEGKESLKIGDTSYDCTWIKGTMNNKTGRDGEFTAEVKIWMADKAPARPQPKAVVPPKNVVSSGPPTGIVKVTSSYKLGEQPGEIYAEIVEWGNDGRKVAHANREGDGKLVGKPAGGNPFRHAQEVKVGDYVVFKVTEKSQVVAAASGQMTTTSTLTVSDRDEKAVAFDNEYVLSTIDLTKPFDMCTAVVSIHTFLYPFIGLARDSDQGPNGFQKTGEGKEIIKIGNKIYDCTWIEGKVNHRVFNKDPRNSYTYTAEMKIWIANDAQEDKIDVRPLKFVPKDSKQIGGKGMLTPLADAAAVEKLVGKEAAKGLIDQVDFDKEKIVFVSWSSGGPPFGTLHYEAKGKGKDRQLVFYVQGPGGMGRGKGLRIGADFFACPKWLAVGFERGERKFDPKIFEDLRPPPVLGRLGEQDRAMSTWPGHPDLGALHGLLWSR